MPCMRMYFVTCQNIVVSAQRMIRGSDRHFSRVLAKLLGPWHFQRSARLLRSQEQLQRRKGRQTPAKSWTIWVSKLGSLKIRQTLMRNPRQPQWECKFFGIHNFKTHGFGRFPGPNRPPPPLVFAPLSDRYQALAPNEDGETVTSWNATNGQSKLPVGRSLSY